MNNYSSHVNVNKIGNAEYPDMVYYNLDIINGKTIDEGINSNPTARFNETRDTAIIKDTSKYYFSIVRFTMNGSDKTLPMFIPRIELGQNNPDKTVYKIALSLDISYDIGGTSYQTTLEASSNIIYESQNSNVPRPVAPLEVQDLETDYYFVYTYDHVVNLVNKTFSNIQEDLNTQFRNYLTSQGETPVDLSTNALYMNYNPSTERFQLYCDSYGYGEEGANLSNGTNSEEKYSIYFNSNMYGLFSHFSHLYQGGDLASKNIKGLEGYAYKILVKNNLGTNIYRPSNPTNQTISNVPSYYKIEQNYKSTSSLWSPISSIVFCSTLIPVLNEQTGEPIKYGSGNVIEAVGTQSAFQPIITDIALGNTNANAYNEFLSYIPTAEYRLSTLSNSPTQVRDVDIQVYWKSRLDGNLYPIELFNLSSIQIKILFRRRDYF